jgi:hypothetical protein
MNIQSGRLLDRAHRIVGCERFSDAQPHGDSVRVRKLGSPGFENPPTAAYLVYIRLEAGANLTVRHMFRDSLIDGSIQTTEEALLKSAKTAAGSPEQVGKDFETMLFEQPCYFTIVLDNDNWDFYFPDPESVPEPGAEAQDPIVFIASKTTLIEQPNGPAKRETKTYDPNTSFYDAKEIVVSGRSAVRCINFHRNLEGEPLKRYESQNLGFEILLRVPFSVSPTEDHKIVIIIDPDGQNQGPD